MKIKIDKDELYPFYSIDQRWGIECSVHKRTVARWRKVMRQFSKMQDEMRKALDGDYSALKPK